MGTDDFALIAIDPSRYADVEPAMRTYGGPTGVSDYRTTPFLAPIRVHGNGIGFGSTPATRPRPGLLYYDDAKLYRADIPVVFGDSGGPILDATTGAAVGIVSHLETPPATLEGPTVARFIQMMGEAGLHVEIVTAPLAPPL